MDLHSARRRLRGGRLRHAEGGPRSPVAVRRDGAGLYRGVRAARPGAAGGDAAGCGLRRVGGGGGLAHRHPVDAGVRGALHPGHGARHRPHRRRSPVRRAREFGACARGGGVMIAWLFLLGSIVTEVAGTLCLRMGGAGSRLWYIGVGVLYAAAFSMLALVLAEGMPLGVAYGIWSAAGVAITAVLGRVLFAEAFTWLSGLGIVLIVGGVLLVETGAA